MIAWLRWWLELVHARHYAYRKRGDVMASRRAAIALERCRMRKP